MPRRLAPRCDELLGTRGEFLDAILRHQAGLAGSLHDVLAAQMRREQHQRRRPRMIGDVTHREHAAVAVADDHRVRESALGHPARGDAIVFDALARKLERTALRGALARVLRMSCPAAIERKARQAELQRTGGRKRSAPT